MALEVIFPPPAHNMPSKLSANMASLKASSWGAIDYKEKTKTPGYIAPQSSTEKK